MEESQILWLKGTIYVSIYLWISAFFFRQDRPHHVTLTKAIQSTWRSQELILWFMLGWLKFMLQKGTASSKEALLENILQTFVDLENI